MLSDDEDEDDDDDDDRYGIIFVYRIISTEQWGMQGVL